MHLMQFAISTSPFIQDDLLDERELHKSQESRVVFAEACSLRQHIQLLASMILGFREFRQTDCIWSQ